MEFPVKFCLLLLWCMFHPKNPLLHLRYIRQMTANHLLCRLEWNHKCMLTWWRNCVSWFTTARVLCFYHNTSNLTGISSGKFVCLFARSRTWAQNLLADISFLQFEENVFAYL
jgi:hypothetical protein